MPVYKFQNCKSSKFLDSKIDNLSDFNSTNNKRPSTKTTSSNSSISQKWFVDAMYTNTYIRSCVDKNFCLTQFDNTITHQASLTVEKCYSGFDYCCNPLLQITSAAGGICRIRNVATNLYLTDIDSTSDEHDVLWTALSTSDLAQQWAYPTASATPNTTLTVYQNINQKYTVGQTLTNACEACAISDAAAYYHQGPYTYDEMLSDKFIDANGVVISYAKCRYCNITLSGSILSYAQIKAKIDGGQPVIVRLKDSSDRRHTVMAYGYKNSCSSADDLFVLDPANTQNNLHNIGLFFTLTQAMNHSSKPTVVHHRVPTPKS